MCGRQKRTKSSGEREAGSVSAFFHNNASAVQTSQGGYRTEDIVLMQRYTARKEGGGEQERGRRKEGDSVSQ